jgi:hypothetical protein
MNSLPFWVLMIFAWPSVEAYFSYSSGWRSLAYEYPWPKSLRPAEQTIFGSLRMNSAYYSSCVTIGVDAAGIYLVPILPFRLFHGPILIPWTDMAQGQFRTDFWQSAFSFVSGSRSVKVTLYGKPARIADSTISPPLSKAVAKRKLSENLNFLVLGVFAIVILCSVTKKLLVGH